MNKTGLKNRTATERILFITNPQSNTLLFQTIPACKINIRNQITIKSFSTSLYFFRKKEIPGLDISVNDSRRVKHLHSFSHLVTQELRTLQIQLAFLLQKHVQILVLQRKYKVKVLQSVPLSRQYVIFQAKQTGVAQIFHHFQFSNHSNRQRPVVKSFQGFLEIIIQGHTFCDLGLNTIQISNLVSRF